MIFRLTGLTALARLAGKPAAEDRLRAALRFGPGRNRVHLGGVDEVDALRDGVVELRVRVGFAVLLPPGHRAETEFGNGQRRAGKRAVFHRGPSEG